MNQRIVTLFFLLAAFTGWFPSARAALPTLQKSVVTRVESQLATQSPETWELVDVQPYGFTDDGTPLALFVFVELPDTFDMFAPVSTRAGPETHTRVLYVVQPVLGLEVLKHSELFERQPELYEKYIGMSDTDLFHEYANMSPGNPKWVIGRIMEIRRFEERNGFTTDAYFGMREQQAAARKRQREAHQDYVDQLFWDVLQEDGNVRGLNFFRYWALTQQGGFGVTSITEAGHGFDLYANELSTGQRWGRGATGSIQLGLTAFSTQQMGNFARVAFQRSVQGPGPSLIHLTDDLGEAGILADDALNGSHGIFSVPSGVANESVGMRVLRTGLTPGKAKSFVDIPDAALGLFTRPKPIGPYSSWKYLGGVRYAPSGSINMATGMFTPASGGLFGPTALIYGPDVLFYGGLGVWGGTTYYSYQLDHGNEP